MRAQNPDFHNVCFPCPNGFQAFMRMSEEKNFKSMDAPCDSNRSSASSTSSLGKMDSRSPQDNELADHLALCIEESVVKVGAAAQLRRRNSSLSRKNSGLRPKVRHETTSMSPEEWSETFVAQDGVLTTNFCSTEL